MYTCLSNIQEVQFFTVVVWVHRYQDWNVRCLETVREYHEDVHTFFAEAPRLLSSALFEENAAYV